MANVFQHASGTFLLSTGKYFAFCQKVANYSLVFGGFTVAVVSAAGRNVETFLFMYTFIFLFSSAFYFRKAKTVLKSA